MIEPNYTFYTSPQLLEFKNPPDYRVFSERISLFDTLCAMNNQSICIIDFYKHNYFYIHTNHIFLHNNYTEAKAKGELYANDIIAPADKPEQFAMKNSAFNFFAQYTQQQQLRMTLISTHRITVNNSMYKVTNKYKPIAFDDAGNVWLVVCITAIASKTQKIESYISFDNTSKRFEYKAKAQTFAENKRMRFTPKEQEVLQYSSQGFSTVEISNLCSISPNTVKFHKKNILKKTHAKSIAEASLWVMNNMTGHTV